MDINTDERGVEYVEQVTEVAFLATFPEGWAQCPACHRAWNDEKSTSVTPAPSGRCPFEDQHLTLDEVLDALDTLGVPQVSADYRVSFRIATAGDPSTLVSRTRFEVKVSIIAGYSTFADIPKIIAVKRGLDVGEIVVYSADLISLEVDGVKQ